MNSEISPIPESDNTNSERLEPKQEPSKLELTMEADTSENHDEWLELESDEDIEIVPESPSGETTVKHKPEDTTVNGSDSQLEPSDSLEPENTETINESNQQGTEKLKAEPELFADSWLDESVELQSDLVAEVEEGESAVKQNSSDNPVIFSLEERKTELQKEIENLQIQKERMLQEQLKDIQESIGRIVDEGTRELQSKKIALQGEIEKLERRKERINLEMRRNFAGSSQELAVRVQGFKNYLVGSLQDLATAADKLELGQKDTTNPRTREGVRSRENPRRGEARRSDSRREEPRREGARAERDRSSRRERSRDRERDGRRNRNSSDQLAQNSSASAQFSEPTFAEQGRRIRQLLDQYRNSPDYYGSPWQLRRTFEGTHAKRVQDWFFTQGGRGAVDSMGSRLQNILVASAAVSIIHALHGDRCRLLVLTDTPENLGEWRRGLMDCLGIARSSFGANRGVMLFDSPEVLIQGAERLLNDKLLPVIIVDETEEMLNLSVLKFPLWLAFASTGKQSPSNYLY